MKTGELIDWLRVAIEYGAKIIDMFDKEDERIGNEIIKRLEEFEELKKIMHETKLLIDELVKERDRIKQLFKV